MLVKFNSFNPSVNNNRNVNRTNLDRTSFQQAYSAILDTIASKQTIYAKEAEMLGTYLAQGGQIARIKFEQLSQKAHGAAKTILRNLESEHPRNIISA